MTNPLPTSPDKFDYKTKTFSDLKESLFDDDDIDFDPYDNKRKLWIKPQKSHTNSLKTSKILFEGFMAKKGKKTKLKKVRYYILTSEFLAYKEKPQSPTIKKLMLLERTKLEFYTRPNVKNNGKGPKRGFLFSRNKKGAKVYTRDELVYNGFKEQLSRLCILSSFLDDYSIVKLIGQGSYGKVYLVKRKADNTLFATKMFQKDVLLSERKGKATLINEIRVLRRLVHPGIMKLYEVHETRISITLIMELLEGGELFERLDTMKFNSEGDFALLLRKILEPLLFMHENEIMHRDIKPENLIMRSKSNDYDVVIADFGLAQEIKKKFIHIRCGTPGYCAPEVLASKAHKPEYDLKCDVFSIGCVFYQIITGNLPFPARNLKEMFSMNKECDISFEDPKIQVLSTQARSLLQMMLTKDQSKRPTLAQCLNHDFFFEENKKVNNVVLSFVHQSVNLFARYHNQFHEYLMINRNFQGAKNTVNGSKDPTSVSNLDPNGSFTLGRPNLIRGHLETVEEITVLSAAVGIQQMLGLPRSLSQKAIQEKLSLKYNGSKTKLFSGHDLKSLANVDHEHEEGEVMNTSLDEPDTPLKEEDMNQANKQVDGEALSTVRKEKVDSKMQNLTGHGKIHNPFQENPPSVKRE